MIQVPFRQRVVKTKPFRVSIHMMKHRAAPRKKEQQIHNLLGQIRREPCLVEKSQSRKVCILYDPISTAFSK